MDKIKQYEFNNCKVVVQVNSFGNTELKVRKKDTLKTITMCYVKPKDLIEV